MEVICRLTMRKIGPIGIPSSKQSFRVKWASPGLFPHIHCHCFTCFQDRKVSNREGSNRLVSLGITYVYFLGLIDIREEG